MTNRLVFWLPSPWQDAGSAALIIASAVVLALLLYWLGYRVLAHIAGRTKNTIDDAIEAHTRGPARLILPAIALLLVAPTLPIDAQVREVLRHSLGLVLIGAVAWLVVRLTAVLRDVIIAQYDIDREDNLKARKVHTQLRVLERVATIAVSIIALGTMLTTFEDARQFGSSILASAGLIGLIAGIAAQRTLANFIAGIQIAITQPIRLDDVIIAEGEWGRIEEITFTYVVLRIWDQRRLILPISHFIEKPFQNWTRVTADLLGAVYLYADYGVPVEAVREELQEVLRQAPQWDGRVAGVQVTNASEKAVEMRVLVSAKDAGDAWDLRCFVREKLIGRLRERYAEHLPKLRAELGYPRGG